MLFCNDPIHQSVLITIAAGGLYVKLFIRRVPYFSDSEYHDLSGTFYHADKEKTFSKLGAYLLKHYSNDLSSWITQVTVR